MILRTYKYPQGYCYLYDNKSDDVTLEDELTFEMENLKIVSPEGHDGDTKLTVCCNPGEFLLC